VTDQTISHKKLFTEKGYKSKNSDSSEDCVDRTSTQLTNTAVTLEGITATGLKGTVDILPHKAPLYEDVWRDTCYS